MCENNRHWACVCCFSGEAWRTMRLAWQPSFQSGSLEGYTNLMDQCAVTLAEVRERRGAVTWGPLHPTCGTLCGSIEHHQPDHDVQLLVSKLAKPGPAWGPGVGSHSLPCCEGIVK